MKKRGLPIVLVGLMLLSGCGSKTDVPTQAQDGSNTYSLDGGVQVESSFTAGDVVPRNDSYMTESYVEEPDWDTEEYSYIEENGFVNTKTQPFSTFAADVDTASYANMRRQLRNGGVVNPDSIRTEELMNYFTYNLPEPNGDEPFSVTTEISDCPWNPDTNLLFVGLQAEKLDTHDLPQSNFVFLIDVSGSMDQSNKLPLVQRSFMTLVENMDSRDKVSIVTYSAGEDIIIDGKDGDSKNEIMYAIENLTAGGSTNGESALQMAYEIAEKHFIDGGNNRIIMATDGDFNVGVTSEGELTRIIKEKAKSGIYLSVLGYGMGNYKDTKLESLADNGNGNYAYIDDIAEARKVLIDEMGGTLFTVAKDVKLQVEFNPSMVKGYRLIGYENRKMNAEDFDDDTKDGGELGAGHSVVVLYEIATSDSAYRVPGVDSKYGNDSNTNTSDEYLTVNVRYKEPNGSSSTLLEYPVSQNDYVRSMSDNMQWAAVIASTSALIKESPYAGSATFAEIKSMAGKVAEDDYKAEFIELLDIISKNHDDTYARDYYDGQAPSTPDKPELPGGDDDDDAEFLVTLCENSIDRYARLTFDDEDKMEALEKTIEDSLAELYELEQGEAERLFSKYSKAYVMFHFEEPNPIW